jgi:predicted 3-demethylubiquinone-9 3-methyltransferase (glyoxalase superfamily)
MATTIRPFLMFEGVAEEAMGFYVSLFPDGKILDLVRFGAEGPGAEGSVSSASFSLAGQVFRAFDSPAKHAFTFTPSVSIFVDCEDEPELDRVCAALLDGGTALMPPGAYGFSRRFAWVNDRYGLSWQLNLP